MLTLGNGEIFEAIIKDMHNKGYTLFYKIVNAKDYSVPQHRERIIIVGFRNDLNLYNFEFPKNHNKIVTLREALVGLPEPKKEDICNAPYSSRYMSRNRKRSWDEVSYTIPAMAKQVPLHPSSPEYFNNINPLFEELRRMSERKMLWRELENKEERFYIPLLTAFVKELMRLDNENSREIPKNY